MRERICSPVLNIWHIDAHPDLYEKLLDSPSSHASPFARLMEGGNVARLDLTGTRTLHGHQCEQARQFGVEIHEMRDLSGVLENAFDGPVYLSFDLDALDPAFASNAASSLPEQGIFAAHTDSATLLN